MGRGAGGKTCAQQRPQEGGPEATGRKQALPCEASCMHLALEGPYPDPHPLSMALVPPPHLREKLDPPVLQELLVLAAPR